MYGDWVYKKEKAQGGTLNMLITLMDAAKEGLLVLFSIYIILMVMVNVVITYLINLASKYIVKSARNITKYSLIKFRESYKKDKSLSLR